MSKDISRLFNSWPLNLKSVNARIIKGYDGQNQIQLRLDCGILQMYLDGRPDGLKPHKCQTLLEYLQRQADEIDNDIEDDVESSVTPRRAWLELDREMTQFYHRRLALLTVAQKSQEENNDELARNCYRKAAYDAEYTLRAMDYIREHSKDEDHIEVHERFRPFVLWHWTIALTQQKIIDKDFDLAVEQVKQGMGNIAKVYEDHGITKWLKHDPSMAELKTLEKQLRKRYGIAATLQEQLQSALASENYENAAKIRDQLKAKGRFPVPKRKVVSGNNSGF
ncbi:MAG: UvrB/UvrC motif-containing protein [Phycisphaerae bacterium]